MRVVLSLPPDADACWPQLLRTALPNAEIVVRDPAQPPDANALPADYAVAYGPCEALCNEAHPLKAIFTLSAGVGHLLKMPNLPHGVPVVRLEDAGMAEQMVRYVLAAALGFVQRMTIYAGQQRASRWEQHDARSPASVQAGVMGVGVIGSQIALALAEHGLTVRGYARTSKMIAGVQVLAGESRLDAFLDGVDLLVCVLPHTAATDGILNRKTLLRLADGAHVVNIGRGAALVEEDLIALIDSGKLSGATLDVFREEPLPPGHPFWRRPEIVVTPHVSGLTVPEEAVRQVAGKIARLERGEPVTGIVAIARGY